MSRPDTIRTLQGTGYFFKEGNDNRDRLATNMTEESPEEVVWQYNERACIEN